MVEPAIIIATIALVSGVLNGVFTLFKSVNKSECGIFRCERGNNNLHVGVDSEGHVSVDVPMSSDD